MKENIKRHFRNLIWYYLVSIVFVFFQITGLLLAKDGTMNWTLLKALGILVFSVTGGILLVEVLSYLKGKLSLLNWHEKRKIVEEKKRWQYLFFFWLLVVICYVIMLLIYFPGICSYDFHVQVVQGIKNEFTSHHPLLHTLLIRFFWGTGYFSFENANIGIALYCLTQILFSASVFAYGAWILLKTNGKRSSYIAYLVFSCLFPPHAFMMCTVTKDSIFSLFFLLFVLAMIDIIWLEKQIKLRNGIILSLAIFGTAGFRNNGRYALYAAVFVLFFMVLLNKKDRKLWGKIFVLSLAVTVLSIGAISGTEKAYGCKEGDPREKISVPIQQIARVADKYPDALTEEQYDILSQCVEEEAWECYSPYISDPVKDKVNSANVVRLKKDFLQLYISLFLQYPGEYVDAFLELIAGYVYVNDESCAWIYGNDPGYGYIQTGANEIFLKSIGIYRTSCFTEALDKVEDWVIKNGYLDIPVLKQIMSPGIWLYLVLFLIARDLTKKQYKNMVSYGFIMAYYATMFLGPTVQLRYTYPIMLSAFALLLLQFVQKEDAG